MKIPKTRTGSLFASLLTAPRRIDVALPAAVITRRYPDETVRLEGFHDHNQTVLNPRAGRTARTSRGAAPLPYDLRCDRPPARNQLQRAGRIFHDALAAIPRHGVDELRAEETELIDHAVNSLMSIATDSNTSARTRVEAWSAIRGWAKRKARLLGLDGPTKHAVLTLDALDAQIAALEAELAAAGEKPDDLREGPGEDDSG